MGANIYEITNINSLDSTTIVADSLQNLLDLPKEAVMEDGSGKFDDTEMAWAFFLVFFTGFTLEIAIDSTEMRIVRTVLTRLETLLIPVIRLTSM